MLVSTMMTGHDGNHADGPFEMATRDVSRAHFYGEARKLARLCRSMYGHVTQRQFGETLGQKC